MHMYMPTRSLFLSLCVCLCLQASKIKVISLNMDILHPIRINYIQFNYKIKTDINKFILNLI